MTTSEAREQILALCATVKLTEKEIRSREEELGKWKERIDLARSKGRDDLAAEAEKETEKLNTKLAELRDEEQGYKNEIESLRQQLPGLAARERTIDPDLLEQELLMALGRTEEEAATEKAFSELEKESAADKAKAALEELKAKMNNPTP